jgi:hypothetical protein
MLTGWLGGRIRWPSHCSSEWVERKRGKLVRYQVSGVRRTFTGFGDGHPSPPKGIQPPW